jgi:hypothetical protein
MSIVKAFRYPVSVGWRRGRMTRASAAGKTDLDLATPPEFRGGVPGAHRSLRSPTGSRCPSLTLQVDGLGHVEKRRDGRYAFVAIELTVEIETDDESLEAARAVVRQAEERCIVTLALDVPVHVRLVLPSATGVGLSE